MSGKWIGLHLIVLLCLTSMFHLRTAENPPAGMTHGCSLEEKAASLYRREKILETNLKNFAKQDSGWAEQTQVVLSKVRAQQSKVKQLQELRESKFLNSAPEK